MGVQEGRTMPETPDGLCSARRSCSAKSFNGTSCGQVLAGTVPRSGLGLQDDTSRARVFNLLATLTSDWPKCFLLFIH